MGGICLLVHGSFRATEFQGGKNLSGDGNVNGDNLSTGLNQSSGTNTVEKKTIETNTVNDVNHSIFFCLYFHDIFFL